MNGAALTGARRKRSAQTWRRVRAPHSAPRGSVASRARASDPVVDVSQRLRANAGRPHRPARIASELLADNPLGDPAERPLGSTCRPATTTTRPVLPAVYVIQGYTGTWPMWHNRSPFRPTFPEAVDALFAAGDAPACIVVFVDAWTAYGGSQFVDSPGTGRYHSYLCDEVVPFVDARYRTLARPRTAGDRRQVERRVRRDDHADAPARPVRRRSPPTPATRSTSSATCGTSARPRARCGRTTGSYDAFWEDFRSRPPMTQATDGDLSIPSAARPRSRPTTDGTPRLPFDPRTGGWSTTCGSAGWRGIRSGWCPARRRTAGLRAIWLDAGTRDDCSSISGRRGVPRALAGSASRDVASSCSRRRTRHRLPLPARPGLPGRALIERHLIAGPRPEPDQSEAELRGAMDAYWSRFRLRVRLSHKSGAAAQLPNATQNGPF